MDREFAFIDCREVELSCLKLYRWGNLGLVLGGFILDNFNSFFGYFDSFIIYYDLFSLWLSYVLGYIICEV